MRRRSRATGVSREQPVERDEREILGGPGEVQVEREIRALLR